MKDNTPRRNFYTTLFDRNYFLRGITMLRSLIRHSSTPPFINVLALDKVTERWLSDARLPGVCITSHRDFEVLAGTVALQHTRTWKELCWTYASLYTLHIAPLTGWNLTYLDADLYFFSDPQVIHDEIDERSRSIGIIPHRFADKDKAYEVNGRFNVSWVSFKGVVGRQCLQDWALKCRAWCHYRNEGGKFGDQGYLDAWPEKYPHEVCEIGNIGAGLAPWNVDQYDIVSDDTDTVMVGSPDSYRRLVFYHFSGFQSALRLAGPNWCIPESAVKLIYNPYWEAMTHEHNRQRKALDIPTIPDNIPMAGTL